MSTSANEQIEMVLSTLTEAYVADPIAIQSLMNIQVDCNSKLSDHPTVQVRDHDGIYQVGALGLINGIVERLTGQRIAAAFDENILVGFVQYKQVKDKS